MERFFVLDSSWHGRSPVVWSWSPQCRMLATAGILPASALPSLIQNTHPHQHHNNIPPLRVIHIFNRRGKLIDQIPTSSINQTPNTNAAPVAGTSASTSAASSSSSSSSSYSSLSSPSPCLSLDWDSSGQTLAILLGSPAHSLLLWDSLSKEIELLDLSIREPSFIKWSKVGSLLAVGGSKGELILYDRQRRTALMSSIRHKKRITCGDWNNENKFAFASDDRQITIINAEGKVYGQVKVKSRPTNVKFGSNNNERENIVSVSMDRKTILLYNLDDPENALELAFQARYGSIVAFKWFKDGYVMVGFSLGYLVVISTRLDEIGREQFCARFHRDSLRDLSYSSFENKIITASDTQMKLVDMKYWKEIAIESLEKAEGFIDKLYWSHELITVSTRAGYLIVFISTDVLHHYQNLNQAQLMGSGGSVDPQYAMHAALLTDDPNMSKTQKFLIQTLMKPLDRKSFFTSVFIFFLLFNAVLILNGVSPLDLVTLLFDAPAL